VSADYRLATFGWNASDISEDVLDSFAWLVDKGADFGMDADRTACMGESAGGWACAYLAHRSNAAWTDNTRFKGSKIKGMLGAYPPYDFRAFLEPEFQKLRMATHNLDALVPVLSLPHNSTSDLSYQDLINARVDPFNILTYVTSESPPTVTVHGDSDKIVSVLGVVVSH
jgi:acetyl esterase/lipase